ncbi:AttA.2 family protein [Megaselia abdita]
MNSKFAAFALVQSCLIMSSSAQLFGSASSNPSGGFNTMIGAGKSFGTPNQNANLGAFASRNTMGGPVTTGLFGGAHKNGAGFNLLHTNTPGVGSTFKQGADLNLLNQGNHKLDANAFHQFNKFDNGLKFNSVGGGLDYNHAAGHGASLGVSHIPKFDHTKVDLTGKANLWRSVDRATSLDLTGSASRTFSPSGNRNDFGAGLGLNHRF